MNRLLIKLARRLFDDDLDKLQYLMELEEQHHLEIPDQEGLDKIKKPYTKKELAKLVKKYKTK